MTRAGIVLPGFRRCPVVPSSRPGPPGQSQHPPLTQQITPTTSSRGDNATPKMIKPVVFRASGGSGKSPGFRAGAALKEKSTGTFSVEIFPALSAIGVVIRACTFHQAPGRSSLVDLNSRSMVIFRAVGGERCLSYLVRTIFASRSVSGLKVIVGVSRAVTVEGAPSSGFRGAVRNEHGFPVKVRRMSILTP